MHRVWRGRPARNAPSESHMRAVTGRTASVVKRSVRPAFEGTMIDRASTVMATDTTAP